MTYDFFLKYYDVSEYEVTEMHVEKGCLFISFSMPVYLELIANGYRPEMNVDYRKTFIFEVAAEDGALDSKTFPVFKEDRIILGNKVYILRSNTVTVKE